MNYCEDEPRPCCLEHFKKCWAGCGDKARILKRQGMLVGAFCGPCFRELAHGIVPRAPSSSRSNRMGSKARLRHLQDQAAAC